MQDVNSIPELYRIHEPICPIIALGHDLGYFAKFALHRLCVIRELPQLCGEERLPKFVLDFLRESGYVVFCASNPINRSKGRLWKLSHRPGYSSSAIICQCWGPIDFGMAGRLFGTHRCAGDEKSFSSRMPPQGLTAGERDRELPSEGTALRRRQLSPDKADALTGSSIAR